MEEHIARIAGRSYGVRTVAHAGRTWAHFEEDGQVVASCALPAGPERVLMSAARAWARRQLGHVRECDMCHVLRYTTAAGPGDLAAYREWADLNACPACWTKLRRALATGALGRVGAPPAARVSAPEGSPWTPDPARCRFAVRPDARGGAVALTPVELAAEVGARGRVLWWRREHGPEGWRYELSVADADDAHRLAVRCHWDHRAQRWAVDREPVAWAVNRVALVQAGDWLVPGPGEEPAAAGSHAAGSLWRVTRGLPQRDALEVRLPWQADVRWLVRAAAMAWCDAVPTDLELHAARIAAAGDPSPLVSAQQAARILRQGRPWRHVEEPPEGDVVPVQPLREWAQMHQGQFPTLSLGQALLACWSGMLAAGVPCWPPEYGEHYRAYVEGVPARDGAELNDHTAFHARELRSIEAAMAALAAASRAGGGA